MAETGEIRSIRTLGLSLATRHRLCSKRRKFRRSDVGHKEFDGKAVLVTGATSGIGEECARAFAERGAKLLLTGRDESRGNTLLETLQAMGCEAAFHIGDVRNSAFCDSAVAACLEEFGRIDVLVNSAGIWQAKTTIDTDDETWCAIMETNASGTFFMCRAALRAMCAQGSGNIINIASDWGLVGGAEAAAYCASKGAVVLMTKAMALDHARDNIRVNALCPTDTDTPMMDQDYRDRGIDLEEGRQNSANSIPVGRMATARDVADAACFMASDKAAFLTGVALPIDGGATAV